MADDQAPLLARVVGHARALIRLRPHDTGTPEGRAQERHRRVVLAALAAAAAKVISVATALISVPLTLHYLGPERYGLWVTISSLVAILAFADLGIGNGLVNTIAAAHGRQDRRSVRGYVSSGFFVLTLVALGMLAVFAAVYAWVPWPAVFNVKSAQAQGEVGPAVAVFVACFTLAMPVGIVGRVQVALQQGFMASLWQCGASACGLLGIIIAIRHEAGLPWLVLAFMGAPLLASALNSLVFFSRQQPDIAPARHAVTRADSLQLLRTGSLFLVLQVVAAVAYASDSFIISQLLGAPAVADYAVPERLFSLITMVLAMVLAPLWPAYGEAISRGDVAWVKHTLKRSVVTAVGLAALCAGALVLAGEWILRAWVGPSVQAPLLLLVGLAVWKTIEAGGNALAMFLNGAHVVRSQVVMAICTAASALAFKLFLIPHIGVSGAVWATSVSYLLLTALPSALLLPGIVRRLRSNPSTTHVASTT